MTIKLNFDTKQVTPEGNCNLRELVKLLKKVVPDWKEWDVVQEIQWTYTTPWIQTTPTIIYNTEDFNYKEWTTVTDNTTNEFTLTVN